MAVIFGILSALIVFSEVTMYASRDVSPFGVIIHKARYCYLVFKVLYFFANNNHLAILYSGNSFAVQIWGMIPLIYLTSCALFSLFQLQLLEYYNMRSSRRTDENSLLFNASYMLRLIGPLGFNFLTFVRVDVSVLIIFVFKKNNCINLLL